MDNNLNSQQQIIQPMHSQPYNYQYPQSHTQVYSAAASPQYNQSIAAQSHLYGNYAMSHSTAANMHNNKSITTTTSNNDSTRSYNSGQFPYSAQQNYNKNSSQFVRDMTANLPVLSDGDTAVVQYHQKSQQQQLSSPHNITKSNINNNSTPVSVSSANTFPAQQHFQQTTSPSNYVQPQNPANLQYPQYSHDAASAQPYAASPSAAYYQYQRQQQQHQQPQDQLVAPQQQQSHTQFVPPQSYQQHQHPPQSQFQQSSHQNYQNNYTGQNQQQHTQKTSFAQHQQYQHQQHQKNYSQQSYQHQQNHQQQQHNQYQSQNQQQNEQTQLHNTASLRVVDLHSNELFCEKAVSGTASALRAPVGVTGVVSNRSKLTDTTFANAGDMSIAAPIPDPPFVAQCDPTLLACTLNALPSRANLLNKCALPFALFVQPFADDDPFKCPPDVSIANHATAQSSPFTSTSDSVTSSSSSPDNSDKATNSTKNAVNSHQNKNANSSNKNSNSKSSTSRIPLIVTPEIVRCRDCRTYINPYIMLSSDGRRWECNVCSRENETPEHLFRDYATGKPCRPADRPELRHASIEYKATSMYSNRPPPAATYVFCLETSWAAQRCGYVAEAARLIAANLRALPGGRRRRIGLIAYDSALRYFVPPTSGCSTQTAANSNTPGEVRGSGSHTFQGLVCCDLETEMKTSEDLPLQPDLLLANVEEQHEALVDFLEEFALAHTLTQSAQAQHTAEPPPPQGNCLGAAMQAAIQLAKAGGGGRITIMNVTAPSLGPGTTVASSVSSGAAAASSLSSGKQTQNGSGNGDSITTNFFKTLALECPGLNIAFDAFQLGNGTLALQHAHSRTHMHTNINTHTDLVNWQELVRHTGGSLFYYPNYFKPQTQSQPVDKKKQQKLPEWLQIAQENARGGTHLIHQLDVERFRLDFQRYLTRPVAMEAVLRVRCSSGIEIANFVGNCFVRSVNLISLPVVSPDAGFLVQMRITEPLDNWECVSMQSALLYTTAAGERRIRVSTMCLPIVTDPDCPAEPVPSSRAHSNNNGGGGSQVCNLFRHANAQLIGNMLARMACDKIGQLGLAGCREGFVNSVVDTLTQSMRHARAASSSHYGNALEVVFHLRLLPLYTLCLIKNRAFRPSATTDNDATAAANGGGGGIMGVTTRVCSSTASDDRCAAMTQLQGSSWRHVDRQLLPFMCAVHEWANQGAISLAETAAAAATTNENASANTNAAKDATGNADETTAANSAAGEASSLDDVDTTPLANLTAVCTGDGGDAGSSDWPGVLRLRLSCSQLEPHGAYLVDCADFVVLVVRRRCSSRFLQLVLGISAPPIPSHSSSAGQDSSGWLIPGGRLPSLRNAVSRRVRAALRLITGDRQLGRALLLLFLGDSLSNSLSSSASSTSGCDSFYRHVLLEQALLEDRSACSLSYHELLKSLQRQMLSQAK